MEYIGLMSSRCHKAQNTQTLATMYQDHLSQCERLAFAPIAPYILDAATLGEPPEVTTLSSPPNGFLMPSREAIRMNDARLSAFGGMASTHESEEDDENDDESILRDAVLNKRREGMREHSFRLPSEASRREVSETLRSMNCNYND
jgi:hypothetical protein